MRKTTFMISIASDRERRTGCDGEGHTGNKDNNNVLFLKWNGGYHYSLHLIFLEEIFFDNYLLLYKNNIF